jgi:hypothetical protein
MQEPVKFYFVDGDHVDGVITTPLYPGITREIMFRMTSILSPDKKKSYSQVQDNLRRPLKDDPAVVLDEQVTWLVFYTAGTRDPVEAVLTHLRGPPPPPTLRMQLNPSLSHELINTRNAEDFGAWGTWVARQRNLASWLSIRKEWQNWEDLRADFDWDLLDIGFRWHVSDAMWKLLYDAIKNEWVKPKKSQAFSNQLEAFFQLSGEWGMFYKGHHDDVKRALPGNDSYVSLLRYHGHSANPILMAITVERHAKHPTEYRQIFISVSPAVWIYRVMHGNPAVIKGVSLVLHSVTAHAMLQLYPDLEEVHTIRPYENMKQILWDASEKEHFPIRKNGYDLIISLRDNPNFTELWRRQAVARIQCFICLLAPAAVTCGSCATPFYCGDACADHDWHERQHHKVCL